MKPVMIVAQIVLPAVFLFAGADLSSTTKAAGLSDFRPSVTDVFGRRGRGGHDDADECEIDDRCATSGAAYDIARRGRGGHDDADECEIDDRCATSGAAYDIARRGRGGHDDADECEIDDRCVSSPAPIPVSRA